MIYLDNSATTELETEVFEAMRPFYEGNFGNASSIHELGRAARVALEDARAVLANFINADSREIVFTASGTEANNTAIKGPIFQRHFSGVPFTTLEIVTSPAEHHAVLEPVEFLTKLGVRKTFAKVDPEGRVTIATAASSIHPETTLLSLMLVNNETGTMNDLEAISRLAIVTAPNIFIHTDAVQALGKIPLDLKKLGVHFASFSAHKIHGPKGIGALYLKSGTKLEPLMHGGAQERNRRGGTEAVALAVGFAKAIELAALRMQSEDARMEALGRTLRRSLEAIPGIVMNSPATHWLPSIVNFSFAPELLSNIDGEALLIRFDLEGIAISNGSACTSGSMQPSHVLLSMGKGDEVAAKSIRVSLSHQTTEQEIASFLNALKRIMPQ